MASPILSSSIGSKLLIAVTGLCLAVFLVAHLAGNLLFVVGPSAFNAYSHALVSNPLVYVAEAGLLVVFLVHVYKSASKVLSSRSARPVAYVKRSRAGAPSRKSVASSTMIVTGSALFLFVVLHLTGFKFGPWYETPDGTRDLYRLQVEVFSQPLYVAFYVVCMAIVGFHLWHGVSSAAQSLGISHSRYDRKILWIGRGFALIIAAAFALLPIYTYLLGLRS